LSSKEASRKLEKLLSVHQQLAAKKPEANGRSWFIKTITVDGGMMLKDFVQLHRVVHTE
jgi:hypothetical protein